MGGDACVALCVALEKGAVPVCRCACAGPCLAGEEAVQECLGRCDALLGQLQFEPQLVDERARGELELSLRLLVVTIRPRRRLLKLFLRDVGNPVRHRVRDGQVGGEESEGGEGGGGGRGVGGESSRGFRTVGRRRLGGAILRISIWAYGLGLEIGFKNPFFEIFSM